MVRRPQRSTRTAKLFPYSTVSRSGGEAVAEAVDHRVADAAAGDIVARLAGGALVGSEHLRIEARGALVDRDALLALLRLLGRARSSRGHLHAGRIGELLHGVHEGEAALIGHPSERVAVRRAAEAIRELGRAHL